MYKLILYCHKETEIGDTMLVKVQSDKCFNHLLFNFSLTKLKAKKYMVLTKLLIREYLVNFMISDSEFKRVWKSSTLRQFY